MAVLVCICGRCPPFRHTIKVGHGIRRNPCLPGILTPLLLTCQRRNMNQSALSQRCVYSLSPLETRNHPIAITAVSFLLLLKPTGPMKAGGDKNARNRPIGPDDKRDWSYGLLDCVPECRLCKRNQLSLLAIPHG